MKTRTLSELSIHEFLFCVKGNNYTQPVNAIRRELGFMYIDDELSEEGFNGKAPLTFEEMTDELNHRLKSQPGSFKEIEKTTEGTVLHQIVKLIAKSGAFNKTLLDNIINAHSDALQQTDKYGKYPADYAKYFAYTTCYGSEIHYGFNKELCRYLENKGGKHHLQADLNSEKRSSSPSYDGFFGTNDRIINEYMLKQYEAALTKRPQQ